MAVGFALFQERLTITGTSHIDSRWEIKITEITTSDIVGDATEKAAPSYTDTTARLKVSLINPTDSITYNIKIKNVGTLSAKVDNYTVTVPDNNAIVFEVKGIKKGNVLEPNGEQTLKVKVSFREGYIGEPSASSKTSTVKVVIDYVQNLEGSGTSGEDITISGYVPYEVGDVISFAGSNWYVIEDSDNTKDYVILIKAEVLTAPELGDYKVVYNGNVRDTMSYYWSSTCHYQRSYGYIEADTSGCSGHNDYAGSMIKEFLEGTYIKVLGSNNLKEVDGYKIRLLTRTEGISLKNVQNSSTWFYGSTIGSFWGMTPSSSDASQVSYVTSSGGAGWSGVHSILIGVRPVINLYKSAIE